MPLNKAKIKNIINNQIKLLVKEAIQNISPKKKILILVHPDIIFETTYEFIQTYYKAIEWEINNFDYVVTHLFFSEEAPKHLNWDLVKTHRFINFRKMLKQNSNFIKKDKDFSVSFESALPDFLIDNPNSEIYFGGGYKNLCVKATYEKLLYKLEDIIKETNATISCYGPLLITDRYKPQIDSKLDWKPEFDKEPWKI